MTHEEAVHQLFENGLDPDDPDTIGFHGTTWETIEKMVRTGTLQPFHGNGTGNRLYFEPKYEELPEDVLHLVGGDLADPLKNAFKAAEGLAGGHAFAKELGIDLNDPAMEMICDAVFDLRSETHTILPIFTRYYAEVYEYLRSLRIPSRKIKQAYAAAQVRNGIVLGIRRAILDGFPIGPSAAPTNGDLEIVTADGLPLNYLSGIEPMGEFEYDQLEQLDRPASS